jgi:hypothetical protein
MAPQEVTIKEIHTAGPFSSIEVEPPYDSMFGKTHTIHVSASERFFPGQRLKLTVDFWGGVSITPIDASGHQGCKHNWVNTGMNWTYCKVCNADGEFRNGHYQERAG